MKKILILGAGTYQAPLVEAVRQLGHTSYVVSIAGPYPGIELADHWLQADICDTEAVVALARRYQVDAVVTASTDLAIRSLGAVVDALGLPGIGAATARRSTDKVSMKLAFEEHGVPSAAFRIVKSLPEAAEAGEAIGYPLMVKAVDSMGSQGITQVRSPDELEAAWDRATRVSAAGVVLVEEFLEGLEFGAQAMAAHGQLCYVLPHNDQVSPPPYCSPIGHSYPMTLSGTMQEELEDAVGRAMQALGIGHSHANVDCMLTRTGVKIIEIGARVGATCLPECTAIWTGMDVYRQIVELALGLRPDSTIRADQAVAAIYLTSPASGTVTACHAPQWIASDPNLVRLTLYCRPGDRVNAFRGGRDRIGEVVVRGDSAAQAERLARRMVDSIVLEVGESTR